MSVEPSTLQIAKLGPDAWGGGHVPPPPPDIIFEPSRRAADPELVAAIGNLAGELEAAEMRLGLRKRARSWQDRKAFRLAVEALACNCLVVAVYGAGASLAVPRSNGATAASKALGGGVYGEHFLRAITTMAHPNIGLVADVARGGRGHGKPHQLSTIRPTSKLLPALGVGPHGWHSLRRDETGREVLFLRAPKDADGNSENLPFPDHKQRKALRNEVLGFNVWLAEAPLILVPGPDGRVLDKNGRPVDPTDRALRRIFNNASWQQGGRLYGGFWQTMRRVDRPKHLRIRTPQSPEGEGLASVDYGQLFARLAYQQARVALPEGDLYDVFRDGSCRPGVKRIFNAMLFGEGPLIRWPEKTRALFPAGMKLAAVREAIHAKHPGLAGVFGTGAGYRFMFVESNLLTEVLRSLRRQRVFALPIHDAVLVAASEVEAAVEAMTTEVSEAFGLELSATVTWPESPLA